MTPEQPLVIRDVHFYKSVKFRRTADIVPRPEIAFAGKSNSGKSSLLNYVCSRNRLAYVGKTPGKTRLINYFLADNDFYLVDLPGYGYASVSKQELSGWSTMMESFFNESEEELCGIILCMDIRRDPSPQDLQMIAWADYYSVPCAIAATKSDKIAKSKRPVACSRISAFVSRELERKQKLPVYPVSSLNKLGADALLSQMHAMLQTAPAT